MKNQTTKAIEFKSFEVFTEILLNVIVIYLTFAAVTFFGKIFTKTQYLNNIGHNFHSYEYTIFIVGILAGWFVRYINKK